MRFLKRRKVNTIADWAALRWADYPDEQPFESFVILRTPLFQVALNFHDPRGVNPVRELHDHPWSFITFVLKGSYTEVTGTVDGDRLINTHYRHVDFVAKRRHDSPHGIVGMDPDGCTTLMISGPYQKKLWLYYDCTQTPGSGDVTFLKRLP